MERIVKKISLKNLTLSKKKLLEWGNQHDVFLWLDSNDYPQKYTEFSSVLALGAYSQLNCNHTNAFEKLKQYRNEVKDYIFGYLGYDLKNDTENLTSTNFDGLYFPDLYFFQPKKLFFIKENSIEQLYLEAFSNELESDLETILKLDSSQKHNDFEVKIHKRITKKHYLETIKSIQDHIHRGDIYEVNFCQEFYAEDAIINPLEVYFHLNEISKPPFAGFLKLEDKFILSASPERFVRKKGNKVISQPIKGTAKRSANSKTDKELAIDLANDPKERSENIMIVDLVRNDLAKTAIKGSVTVEELCKVYSFKQVHQLISTVTAEVAETVDPIDIVKSLFPMGSMTGAPKIAAMKIIEEMESTKRGVYSGAVGYFSPIHDFDFNVLIRSILYNNTNKYLSYTVGGAITAQSDPEKEYEECLIKAIAMKKALKS